MTPEQQIIAERLDRYIAREGLSSIMNETKWREAMNVLQDVLGDDILFRVKNVRGPEPSKRWDGDSPYQIPYPYKTIEWLEINLAVEHHTDSHVVLKRENFTDRLIRALQAKNIPFYQDADVIRIQAYTRHH